MTAEEFLQWHAYHASAFRGFADWWARTPDERDAKPGDPTRQASQAIWYRLLRDVDLDDAKAATEALLSGEAEEPMGYDRHVKAILTYARSHRTIRLATATHEPTFRDAVRCLTCKDAGVVIVWSLTSMEAVVRGNFGLPATLYTTGVACTCTAGDMMAERDAARMNVAESRVRYNPSRMLVAPWILTDPDEQTKLREFVEILSTPREIEASHRWEP